MAVGENAAAFYNRRVEHHLPRISRATSPVYFQDRADHVGSAVMLKIAMRVFAITAAHVVDNAHKGELVLGAGETTVRVTGTRSTTRLPVGGTRCDDKIDLAIIALDDRSAAKFPPTDCLTADDLAPIGVSHHDDYFLVAGYPHTKQKLRLREDQIDSCRFRKF